MKLQLRDPSSVPGRQWEALIPATNARLFAPSRNELVPLVKKHLAANGLPPMESFDDIDQFICAALTPTQRGRRCYVVPEPEENVRSVPTTFSAVANFITHVVKSGWKYVSQDQANARAEVCAMCPANVPSFGCGACESAALALQGASDLLAEKTTPFDQMIKSCAVCGCSLRLKVWLETEQDNKFPAHCWVRKGQ